MKRINLLIKQTKYLRLERIFSSLKLAIVFVIVLFLLTYAAASSLLFKQKQTISELNAQKKSLLELLLANKEVEAKFVYFRNKQKQLSDILKDDVNFYPYYQLLTDSLKKSTPEARLDTVVIDKSKAVNFTVSFNDFASMLSFFKFAESDDFLKNFNLLILSNFSTVQTTKSSYQLVFRGSFSQLNEP